MSKDKNNHGPTWEQLTEEERAAVSRLFSLIRQIKTKMYLEGRLPLPTTKK